MSAYYKTTGIILNSKDVGEHDRIITCFTQDYGRVDLRAKAVRKMTSKLRAGLQPFCLSYLEFVEGRHGYIATEAMCRECFWENSSPDSIMVLNALRDFFLHFVRGHQKDARLWDFLNSFLREFIQKPDASLNPLFNVEYARWNIIALCGYGPELRRCVVCRNFVDPFHEIFFSKSEGGLVCQRCREAVLGEVRQIAPETVKILRLILAQKQDTLKRLGGIDRYLSELQIVSNAYIDENV